MTSEHIIIVTGAGSGIGRALCVGFSNDNYTVIGIGRSATALEATGKLCRSGRFLSRTADVADAKAVANELHTIESECGPIYALVSNAAIYQRSYFLDLDAEAWDREIHVNLCGAANCCRAVLPGMLDRRQGRIIVVGSLADLNPIPAASAYSASKAGLHALVKAIASEIDRSRYPDVLINELIPGPTKTAMSDLGHAPSAVYPAAKKLVEFGPNGPTGRMFGLDRELHVCQSLKTRLKRLLIGRL